MTEAEIVEGRRRAVIEAVEPQVDCGRFPIKRVVGDEVVVRADVFSDGHDAIACAVLYCPPGSSQWHRVPMRFLNNDRWEAAFTVTEIGEYRYTIEAWVDRFQSWHRDLKKRVEAGQPVQTDLLIGAELVAEAAARAEGEARTALESWAVRLKQESSCGRLEPGRARTAWPSGWPVIPICDLPPALIAELKTVVDRPRARFSAWYELFPRSTSPVAGQARDVCRLHRAIALRGPDGFRRPVLAADPPDRAQLSQRAATMRSPPLSANPAAPGRSAPPKAATRRSCRNWERWPISSG